MTFEYFFSLVRADKESDGVGISAEPDWGWGSGGTRGKAVNRGWEGIQVKSNNGSFNMQHVHIGSLDLVQHIHAYKHCD